MSVHLEFLVEELSAEVLLRGLLPKIAPEVTFEIRVFNGKQALLRKLPDRLRGYSSYISKASTRVVVLLDADDDDCRKLKMHLNSLAEAAGLDVSSCSGGVEGLVLNRIAVEELEAWLLGDSEALTTRYPRVPASYASRRTFRDPDSIKGGTWEALERLLQKSGYFRGGLSKVSIARDLVEHMNIDKNSSASFGQFVDGVRHVVGSGVG